MWEKEDINDYHCLYIRVHINLIKDGMPASSAFNNTPKNEDNLSSDWCKYSSPSSSKELISKQKNSKGEYKNPQLFGIWKFKVIHLREPDLAQEIRHDPLHFDPEKDGEPNNRAHSKIIGEKKTNSAEFKVKMLRAGEWALSPD